MISRIVKDNPALFYSPKERRRLARAESSPGRRRPIGVSVRRPRWNGPTEDALHEIVVLGISGIRRRDFDVEFADGFLTIEIRQADRFKLGQIYEVQKRVLDLLPHLVVSMKVLYAKPSVMVFPKVAPR